LRILGRMAVIGLAPVRLRLIYDLPEAGAQAVLLALVGVLSVALAVWGGVVCWRRSSVAGMGVLFFVLFCLPFLQIVPFNTWSVVSERFLFLPCFGLGLILAPAIRPQPRARAAAAVLLLAGLGLTAWQARLWTPVTGVIEATAKYAPRH
ncbi:MAG: hypothetical protein GWM87_01820, partial [Xanthomonadales bacterium]|nr:hypothetical protein [Xanthomonadales bacterium]NIX11820.1 hypothetical protein [Xanthomonadales bacterium]